jgi:hypothetical protein
MRLGQVLRGISRSQITGEDPDEEEEKQQKRVKKFRIPSSSHPHGHEASHDSGPVGEEDAQGPGQEEDKEIEVEIDTSEVDSREPWLESHVKSSTHALSREIELARLERENEELKRMIGLLPWAPKQRRLDLLEGE